MARPKEFSVEEALENAMQLFWTGGFHATSTREIEKQLHLGRQSIYNAFGDKEALYHASLDRYVATVLQDRLEVLRMADPGRREVVRFLAGIVEFLDGDQDRRGCYLYNAIAESAGRDPFILESAVSYTRSAGGLLQNAIQRGIHAGEISKGTNVMAVSRMLLATESGMSLMARSRVDRKDLVDIASAALQPLY
jgi:TetR/AcrR family transcriptional repressor of nem operon